METGLRGHGALVTGGASGIGRAIAAALAHEGARVVIADINEKLAQAGITEITGRGGSVRYVHCDVTDEASVEMAVHDVAAHEGSLAVMVNNAGIGPQQAPLIDSTAEDWDRVYAVNLRGVFFGIKHAGRLMAAAGGGSIVNIASVAGLGAAPLLGPYGATKAAVIELTQTAAIELARANVRVNAVCPGWTETPILGDADRPQLIRQVPLKRLGQPEEIASIVVYLASAAASFVTGSVFRVDGGMRS
jgi:NAD(P)-dependent dehydrogenase (short-subunit alcohol dehydrogenase family)